MLLFFYLNRRTSPLAGFFTQESPRSFPKAFIRTENAKAPHLAKVVTYNAEKSAALGNQRENIHTPTGKICAAASGEFLSCV